MLVGDLDIFDRSVSLACCSCFEDAMVASRSFGPGDRVQALEKSSSGSSVMVFGLKILFGLCTSYSRLPPKKLFSNTFSFVKCAGPVKGPRSTIPKPAVLTFKPPPNPFGEAPSYSIAPRRRLIVLGQKQSGERQSPNQVCRA